MNFQSSGTLTVILEDINDHDPVFNQPFYRRSVPENSKRGATILTLSADDADLNRSISYSLDGIKDFLKTNDLTDVFTFERLVFRSD